MNIIYIGSSSSSLSLIPLQALIESKHEVSAIAFDDDVSSDFTVTTSDSIQSLAFKNSIPQLKLDKDFKAAVSQLQSYLPDIILVSCYSRLLPQSLLSIAKKGCINIHPSLLPQFRGPAPVFWQFREGVENFGVTLHHMTTDYDVGNILSQTTVVMPDGINITETTKLLANVASDLMLATLDDIENDNVTETVQDNKNASYQSFPDKSDYTVTPLWTAKRMYNFINAYKGVGITFLCEVKGKQYELIDALSYQEQPYDETAGKSMGLENNDITFGCQDGYIRCKIKL